MPTINITEGCAHGCSYCYTQGYSSYPGAGRVVLFENTPELVQAELGRKRVRPRRVYFSPSSDAFQPVPEVLEITYQTMSVLLEWGVEVAFLTKGTVGDRFLALFAKSPTRVLAQIGITTLDESLWHSFEPGAAAPAGRLRNIESLFQIGATTKARLDPLVPDVTDTDENLSMLLTELARRGVRYIAASYLFLRPAFAPRLFEQIRKLAGSPDSTASWSWHRLADGVGGGLMVGPEGRRQRFDRLRALAANHGIEVHVCACKNPDLGRSPGCEIAGPPQANPSPGNMPLFP
jgi:DNA repair photolyase